MIPLSENSMKVLQQRYLCRNAGGAVTETPDEFFHRVAKAVASAESNWGTTADVKLWEEKFYKMMRALLFLPNSPTLMNAGKPAGQLSACFVLPVEDNMNGIFTTLKNAALIQQAGGGTGFNFSRLRPKDDLLNTGGGTASGPVSFMKIFDAVTEHIKQGGKRRGANMGILNIDHPDIEAFIDVKRQKDVLSNFNISVGISDDFMHKLEKNGEWSFIHPNSKATVKKTAAQFLWDKIVESAWQTGDPGLIFLDSINNNNPLPALGNIEATNPCGEVPLLDYEPCNLGSINLSKFIMQDNGHNEVDWQQLEEVVQLAIRFLDDVIEVNHYVIPEIRSMAMGNRKIGLGVMGWADLLIRLELPYDSEKATSLAAQIMGFIRQKSKETSALLAEERGVFPNWKKSIYYPGSPMRNATTNSIAPTGTISIIAGTSSSIEPLFALAFQRRHVLNDETLFTVNRLFTDYLKSHKLYSKSIFKEVTATGTLKRINGLPKPVKELFKTAMEISPIRHLLHQLAFQRYTDNAVSKTINLAETAGKKDVDEIYKTAWRMKAKGITIFRHQSKNKQVLQPGIQYGARACKVCTE
jgi:ribonucleoside-diphosphate reductase alpha chain